MIKRRFLNYRTYNAFKADLDNQEISDESIVFIQENLRIWAHGKEYVCDGPYSADVANGTLTFKNGNDTIIFTISQNDGTIEFTDSEGNKSSATYILKTQFDSVVNNLQGQINTKANKTSVDQINDWKTTFIKYVTDMFEVMPLDEDLKQVAYTGSYNDLTDKPNIPDVDAELSSTSTNPVQNKAVKSALDLKADTTALGDYVLNTVYQAGLNTKQDVLTAGQGIAINRNVISSTLDTSVYIIVEELPAIQDADPNKVYLLEVQNANGTYRYEQYRLRNGQWVSFDAVMPTVDLSSYLTKVDAASTYQPIGNYLTSADLIPYAKQVDIVNVRQSLNDYALISYVETNYQLKGDFATKQYVDDTFVRKSDVYNPKQGEWGTNNASGESQQVIINTGGNVTVDNELSLASSNPVENRIVTRALNLKANASDLQNYALASQLSSKLDANALADYVTSDTLEQGLNTKQDILTPGDGISIVDNVISSTIDTNMWVIVDELPSTNINDNKIYLVETEVEGETIYIEWRHKNGEWVRSGQRMPEIDLSGYQRAGDYATNSQVASTYLTKTDAARTYQPVGNYADVDDVASTYQEKGDYVEYGALEAFRLNLDNTFQKRGAYALAADVTAALTTLQSLIDLKYVLKKDVYIPEGGDFSTSDPTQITIGTSNGDGTGGNNSGTASASNMITLTTTQYEALVRANMVNENTYYFTYEETTWGFGDRFPVTFTDGDTSDSIGTFPINLE